MMNRKKLGNIYENKEKICFFRYWENLEKRFQQTADIPKMPYYITSVHLNGNCAGASRAFSRFCSQMTPSQRPILKPQFSKVEW